MDLSALALLVYSIWVHFRSVNTDTPPKTILHATFVPSIVIGDEELTIFIPNYILHLKSRELPLDFGHIFYNEDGGMEKEMGLPNCYYQGHVENFPNWDVSMTICNGLEGSFGTMKQYYYIMPKPQQGASLQEKITLLSPHLLFSEHSILDNSSNRVCGYSTENRDLHFKEKLEETAGKDKINIHRVVEIVLVNDHALFNIYNGITSSIIRRDLEIIDYMNYMFQKFDISLVLVGVITWSHFDLIEIPNDNEPTQVLVNFRIYLIDVPLEYDSALLITGRDLLGNVVGLAYKSSMCYGPYATGIVQDRQQIGVSLVGGTASHELGHILGMSHDDTKKRYCKCNDPTGKCIMAGLSHSTAPTVWSNCSQSDMLGSFNENPLTEICLFNDPPPNNISTDIVRLDKSIQWQSSPGNMIVALLVISMCTFH